MNTNPKSIRILCFGDSNTWGRIPGDDNHARYQPNVRWTGVLQNKLGKNFEVIEEGLNGRTTSKDSPFKAGKNGVEYLYPSLESHNPIDVVILALGKNELKTQYSATPKDIGKGILKCIETIKTEGKDKNRQIPKIILISPAIIVEKERFRFNKVINDFAGANEKSKHLGKIYREIAKLEGCLFVDLSKIVETGSDGIHLNQNGHKIVGEYLYRVIKDMEMKQ